MHERFNSHTRLSMGGWTCLVQEKEVFLARNRRCIPRALAALKAFTPLHVGFYSIVSTKPT